MLKGAIFDFDGSLIDSMYIWENISMDYLRSLGIEPEEKLNEVFEKFSLEEAALYAAKTAKEDGFNVVGIYDKYEPNQDILKQISDLYIQDYTDERLMKL